MPEVSAEVCLDLGMVVRARPGVGRVWARRCGFFFLVLLVLRGLVVAVAAVVALSVCLHVRRSRWQGVQVFEYSSSLHTHMVGWLIART